MGAGDAVRGEEVGAGAREGTELKISLAALAVLCQALRELAGERLLELGHRACSHHCHGPVPAAQCVAGEKERQLCTPLPAAAFSSLVPTGHL